MEPGGRCGPVGIHKSVERRAVDADGVAGCVVAVGGNGLITVRVATALVAIPTVLLTMTE